MASPQFVAFSGGKDSTAMALRMAELGEDFSLLFTPTGNEMPELERHIERVVAMTGRPLVTPPNRTLAEWIEAQQMLPNPRARWCTRLIKIVPCAAFLQGHAGATLCVGLRADEEHREGGLYGDGITYRRPLQEWGWTLREVRDYCRARGVGIPERTDCAVCPFQRLGEWWDLWHDHPDLYQQGEAWEASIGHTFRSDARDAWPASLADLRREFERGKEPRSIVARRQGCMFTDEDEEAPRCRVCSL
jgi:PP-loop superfamily ATP-utilizing enzyme